MRGRNIRRAMNSDDDVLWVGLYGPMRLRSGDDEIWISSRKSQAMLAMLAMAPGGERTRAWLCDHLWGSRDPEQARSSLRRELSNLRALHPSLDLSLATRGDRIRLDLSRCHIDAHGPAQVSLGPSNFLEGIDIPGEEQFEDWLRETRRSLSAAQPPRQWATDCASPQSPLPTQPSSLVQKHRFCVGIMAPELIGVSPHLTVLAHELLDAIGLELSNRGGVIVFDFRDEMAGLPDAEGTAPAGPDVVLLLRAAAPAADRLQISARLVLVGNRSLIWSRQSRIEGGDGGIDGLAAMTFVNEAAEGILFALSAQPGMEDGRHYALCHAAAGVHQVFGLQPGSVDAAEARFREAHRLSGDPVYLAWLAYMSTFKLDLYNGARTRDVCLEAADLARRAHEAAPYNTQCLALLIHVYGFVLRDFARASHVVDQAIALGARNLMFFDSLALFHIYCNRPDLALAPARKAAEMGRFLPYRYAFETSLCMIETLEGRFGDAAARGQAALGMGPGKAAQPFAPTLRFLATAHSQLGDHETAAGFMRQLINKEPALLDGLVDHDRYPLPSDRALTLFKSAISNVAA